MNIFLQTVNYVMSDQFFWLSMTFTTFIGIFVGSIIYNGDIKDLSKGLILLATYVFMILLPTFFRIMPQITTSQHQYQLFAGIYTICIVTVFYLFGMFLGVVVTKLAHKK